MTNIRLDGNCKICGTYTDSIYSEEKRLCSICHDRITNWSEEELTQKLVDTEKKLWNLEYFHEIPDGCANCEHYYFCR